MQKKVESAFDTRKGMLKIFDEETGIFKSADSFFKKNYWGNLCFQTLELWNC